MASRSAVWALVTCCINCLNSSAWKHQTASQTRILNPQPQHYTTFYKWGSCPSKTLKQLKIYHFLHRGNIPVEPLAKRLPTMAGDIWNWCEFADLEPFGLWRGGLGARNMEVNKKKDIFSPPLLLYSSHSSCSLPLVYITNWRVSRSYLHGTTSRYCDFTPFTWRCKALHVTPTHSYPRDVNTLLSSFVIYTLGMKPV